MSGRIHGQQTVNHGFDGVDTPDKEQLITVGVAVDGGDKEIGAESLSLISIDGLYRAMGEARRDSDCPQFCDACFTGDYPITLATGLSAKRVSHGVIN